MREIVPADVPGVLEILESSVGPGWLTADRLRPGPDRRVVVATMQERLAGVASAELRDWERALPRNPRVRAALVALAGRAPRTAVHLEMGAVAPWARRRGLYGALLADRLAWGRSAGATLATTVGWTPPDGCHIAPAMRSAGFTTLGRVAGLFAADAPAGARCPVCGSPCACDATWFARVLDGPP